MSLITQIMDVYSQIDQQVAAFQLRTGLRCPTGCGICCADAEVYTSTVEMFPAAHEILCRGDSQLWLEEIQNTGLEGLCVFCHKQAKDADGHCGRYAVRPSVCRLFGFASVRNRLGEHVLSTCKLLKKNHPADVAQAVEHQKIAPRFTQFTPLLMSIDPIAARLVPINDALRQAILTLGLRIQMAHGEKLSTHTAA